jgi:uncharacterized membrane protein YhdT
MMLRMRMTSINTRLLKTLVIVDIVVILISIIFFDIKTLYNTQVGYISAALVIIASMISYSRMVNTAVEHNVVTMDDSRDVIDRMEDPYDLYSEEIVEEEERSLVETVKEEKKRLKGNKRTFSQTIKDSKAAFSFYRLGAYVILVLGFLYLNRHGLLHVPSYILALSIPPMVIVITLMMNKENHSQD